jgi:hypothetical protein
MSLLCALTGLVGTQGWAQAKAGAAASGHVSKPKSTTTTTQPAPSTTSAGTTGAYQADIEGGPASADCAPTTLPTVKKDLKLNKVFQTQRGPEWLGGDATYSTALPNGEEDFVFGDTLLGSAATNGRITSFQGIVHDSELVGSLPDLQPNLGNNGSTPSAVIPDSNVDDGWQIGATYMESGQQLVFVNEGAAQPGSIYGTYTGRSAIAVMSLRSGQPVFSSLAEVPTDDWTQWGNAVVQSGGYNYIYGIDFNTTADIWYGLKVARVPVGDSLDFSDWTYWNGSSWAAGESNAAVTGTPLVNGVIPLKAGSGFMGVGVGNSGRSYWLSLTFSCSPTGPWSPAVDVYAIPETASYANEIAYMATFHPEITAAGLVTSYNIDSQDGLSALERNDRKYKPHFLLISG